MGAARDGGGDRDWRAAAACSEVNASVEDQLVGADHRRDDSAIVAVYEGEDRDRRHARGRRAEAEVRGGAPAATAVLDIDELRVIVATLDAQPVPVVLRRVEAPCGE